MVVERPWAFSWFHCLHDCCFTVDKMKDYWFGIKGPHCVKLVFCFLDLLSVFTGMSAGTYPQDHMDFYLVFGYSLC
jgi:hypothetical protein